MLEAFFSLLMGTCSLSDTVEIAHIIYDHSKSCYTLYQAVYDKQEQADRTRRRYLFTGEAEDREQLEPREFCFRMQQRVLSEVFLTCLRDPQADRDPISKRAYQYFVIEEIEPARKWLIDGKIYETLTYCWGVSEGDEVRFIGGIPIPGTCLFAKFIEKNSSSDHDICTVRCE